MRSKRERVERFRAASKLHLQALESRAAARRARARGDNSQAHQLELDARAAEMRLRRFLDVRPGGKPAAIRSLVEKEYEAEASGSGRAGA